MSSSRVEEKAVVNWGEPIFHSSTCSIFKAVLNNQVFAIKSVIPEKQHKFSSEREILRRLNTLEAPNTIKYFEDLPVAKSDYHSYILPMEWMSCSLHDMLENYDELDWADRYKIIIDMANGMAFYHAHHIVHRDIKSFNVLLDDSLQAKFCDFGSSKELAPGALCYETGFSPAWTPPEYMPINKTGGIGGVGFPGDVYSYATTCWEVAIWGGVIPFTYLKGAETTLNDIETAVLAGKRNSIPKSCPNKIAKLITWGWADNPADRPTAQEFLEELSGGLDSMSEKLKAIKI